MAEPLKHLISTAVVTTAGDQLHRAWRDFAHARFVALATAGLDTLELKARAMHVTAALEATLPEDFDRAADIIEAAFEAGLQGWALWPVGEYVARHGQGHAQRALAVLHGLTQRFTAEWAIRPFIVNHPQLTFTTLAKWTTDPSEHVRRLVSEGSRPRLPWGLQLKSLIADPSPTLPLLEALQDDPSDYVRRSVANHLNDIAKDHPALLANWLERHLPSSSVQRRALLRHASRTLIKRCDPRVLHAFGIGATFGGTVSLRVTPEQVALGDTIELHVLLEPKGRGRQSLAIDYAVHHVKANGNTSPKVFKGWTVELAGETRALVKRHAVKPITTRRYFAGRHVVELIVNGRVQARAAFDLRL